MTARLFRNAGLASLTALNQQILQTVEGETTVAEQAAEEALFTEEEGVADPDAETEEEQGPELRGRFVTENPLEFNRVKEWIETNIFGGSSSGMSPLIGAFINEWDVEWRRQQGLGPEDNIGLGPTLEDLIGDDKFINGALWLPLTANNGLPPVFESASVDEETGEEIAVVGVASPLTGVEFIEIEPELTQLKERPAAMFEVARRGRDFIRRTMEQRTGEPVRPAGADRISDTNVARTPAEGGGLGVKREPITSPEAKGPLRPKFPDYMKSLIAYSDPAAEGRETGDPRQPDFVQKGPLPRITENDLVNALSGALSRGGGGGGGGGGGRRELVFDREHLIAQVSDLWRNWMLDPNEPPLDWIGSNIDAYIREARAFWSSEGGQLDFDTYMKGKLRAHDRWHHIYRWKAENETEEQFLARFQQPIAQLGQTGDFTRAQTEAAVTSGASPTEQLQRVMRTPEVEGSGGFSRRLAQTLAGIGVG